MECTANHLYNAIFCYHIMTVGRPRNKLTMVRKAPLAVQRSGAPKKDATRPDVRYLRLLIDSFHCAIEM